MAGRKPIYDTKIKPRLQDIEKWIVDEHMTQKEVYARLGIGADAWYKYCKEKNELGEIVKKATTQLNEEIEAEFINFAIFGKYVTEEVIEYKYILNEDTMKTIEVPVRKTVTKKYVKPDSASGIFTMKNRCNWNDKQIIETNGVQSFLSEMKKFENEL